MNVIHLRSIEKQKLQAWVNLLSGIKPKVKLSQAPLTTKWIYGIPGMSLDKSIARQALLLSSTHACPTFHSSQFVSSVLSLLCMGHSKRSKPLQALQATPHAPCSIPKAFLGAWSPRSIGVHWNFGERNSSPHIFSPNKNPPQITAYGPWKNTFPSEPFEIRSFLSGYSPTTI